jgi:hypothetical protein
MTAILVGPTGGCSEARRCPGLALVIVGAGLAERRSYRFFERCLVGACHSRSEYRGQTAAMAGFRHAIAVIRPSGVQDPACRGRTVHTGAVRLPWHNGCSHWRRQLRTGQWLNSGMKHTDGIHMATNGSAPSRSVSECRQGAAGGWLALQFEFDAEDIDVMYEIVESLDWRNVTFGCTIEATIRCRGISDLITLRLADPGTRGLKWHPEEFTASCHPCLNPAGLMAFVDYFTPDVAIDLVGDARIEFADADVLEQFVMACDARRDRFQGASPI